MTSDEEKAGRSSGPPVATGGPPPPGPEPTYVDYSDRGGDEGAWPAYLEKPLLDWIRPRAGMRVLDVGCGDGYLAAKLAGLGCAVVGIDQSESGVRAARSRCPAGRFERLPATEHLLEALGEGPFDLVVSTEVVEHVYDPAGFARGCFAALRSGGTLVCSTPYHGYVKNLLIALAGRFDEHVDPLWHGGHIKFWSPRTLAALLQGAGFRDLRFRGAGRLPFLWKSMIVAARRPE